jgi:hypothetical protein
VRRKNSERRRTNTRRGASGILSRYMHSSVCSGRSSERGGEGRGEGEGFLMSLWTEYCVLLLALTSTPSADCIRFWPRVAFVCMPRFVFLECVIAKEYENVCVCVCVCVCMCMCLCLCVCVCVGE